MLDFLKIFEFIVELELLISTLIFSEFSFFSLFQISICSSAFIGRNKIYKIKKARLGKLYLDGVINSDSRDYFMSIDAVGNDLRVNPIPNCGKGQPMQAKRMSNGGPTMRGIARLTGPG